MKRRSTRTEPLIPRTGVKHDFSKRGISTDDLIVEVTKAIRDRQAINPATADEARLLAEETASLHKVLQAMEDGW